MLRNFYKPPVADFVSTGMGRRRKRGTKERGKIFQIKEEKENISVNFYLQFAVLNKTEMQIQLCKYCGAAHPFFLTFSSNPHFCDSCVFIFYVFILDKLKKISCCILLRYSQAGIESCSVKQLFGKI